MSIITLSEAKDFLNVIGSDQDVKLQALLDGAEQEALDFMNRGDFKEIAVECDPDADEGDCESDAEVDSDEMAPIVLTYGMPASVRTGVLFLLQKAYEATPDEAVKLRSAAEVNLMPFRVLMGV